MPATATEPISDNSTAASAIVFQNYSETVKYAMLGNRLVKLHKTRSQWQLVGYIDSHQVTDVTIPGSHQRYTLDTAKKLAEVFLTDERKYEITDTDEYNALPKCMRAHREHPPVPEAEFEELTVPVPTKRWYARCGDRVVQISREESSQFVSQYVAVGYIDNRQVKNFYKGSFAARGSREKLEGIAKKFFADNLTQFRCQDSISTALPAQYVVTSEPATTTPTPPPERAPLDPTYAAMAADFAKLGIKLLTVLEHEDRRGIIWYVPDTDEYRVTLQQRLAPNSYRTLRSLLSLSRAKAADVVHEYTAYGVTPNNESYIPDLHTHPAVVRVQQSGGKHTLIACDPAEPVSGRYYVFLYKDGAPQSNALLCKAFTQLSLPAACDVAEALLSPSCDATVPQGCRQWFVVLDGEHAGKALYRRHNNRLVMLYYEPQFSAWLIQCFIDNKFVTTPMMPNGSNLGTLAATSREGAAFLYSSQMYTTQITPTDLPKCCLDEPINFVLTRSDDSGVNRMYVGVLGDRCAELVQRVSPAPSTDDPCYLVRTYVYDAVTREKIPVATVTDLLSAEADTVAGTYLRTGTLPTAMGRIENAANATPVTPPATDLFVKSGCGFDYATVGARTAVIVQQDDGDWLVYLYLNKCRVIDRLWEELDISFETAELAKAAATRFLQNTTAGLATEATPAWWLNAVTL